jgi:WD40 repeat protein
VAFDELHNQLISLDTAKSLRVWDLKNLSCIQIIDADMFHPDFEIGAIALDRKRDALLTGSKKLLSAPRRLFAH